MRGGACVALVGFLLAQALLVALPAPAAATPSPPVPMQPAHAPILIDGDAAFTAGNGVTGGSGSPGDPFFISGWDIAASSTVGIEIRNTSAYAVVRDVHILSNPIWTGVGIYLTNVQHLRTENSTIEYNSVGLAAISSRDVRIANCTLHFNDDTVDFDRTNDAWVEANTIDSNGIEAGVTVRDGRGIVVGNNSFTRNLWAATVLDSTNILVQGNVIRDSYGASIALSRSSALRIENNTLLGASSGISIDAAQDALIAGNLVVDTPKALSVTGSSSVQIERNNLSRAGIGIAFDAVSSSTVTDNLVDVYGEMAVSIAEGTNLTLARNSLQAGGVVLRGTSVSAFDSHTISADNLVNGVPLRYLRDCGGITLDGILTGQLILVHCTDVKLANLSITHAGIGAWIGFSDRVGIENSRFDSNSVAGVLVSSTSQLTIRGTNLTANGIGLDVNASTGGRVSHNSFLQNAQSVRLNSGAILLWDDGYPEGGNLWSDYRGWDDCSGPAQNICPDSDGLGDIVYAIDADNTDYYPLVPVNPPNLPPIAVLGVATPLPAYVTQPIAFLADTSYDPDGFALRFRWDFGDGSTTPVPSGGYGYTHAYQDEGTYTVTLTVTDVRGATATAMESVTVLPIPMFVLVRYEGAGFRLPVPEGWTRQTDARVGDAVVPLLLDGAPAGFSATILLDTGPDDSVLETPEYLATFVGALVREIQTQDPTAYQDGAMDIGTIANHSAVSFVIRYSDSSIVQRVVLVVSEAHGRWWFLLLTSEDRDFFVVNANFERMLAGFQITLPPTPRVTAETFVFVAVSGIAGAAVAASTYLLFLHLQRRKVLSVEGPPRR